MSLRADLDALEKMETEISLPLPDIEPGFMVCPIHRLDPAEAVGFLERKNPQHIFRRSRSKAVGPMS